MMKDFYADTKVPQGFDKKLVEAAFKFAEKVHEGQKRKSGEDYITHPVAVAKILLNLGMDAQMVAAAMLHDIIEDTDVTVGEVEEKFGKDVAMLVTGVTNLGRVDFSAYSKVEEAQEAQIHLKNENLRRLFLAMAEDVRVVVIKLADRLHNMQTIKALPKEDQIRIAKETLNIFSPLALRLGMGEIKGELEDLAFPIAYPKEYKVLKTEANRRYKAADRYTIKVKRMIGDELKKEGITAVIEGRAKHIYSLYKKITRPEINWDFDKIYDLVALRIITTSVADCYRILGIIHSIFRPMPDYIRDYIASPKPNGYRSIHTSVFGPDGKIVEIQIRTEKMHEEAEFGVASHLHYAEQKAAGKSDTEAQKGFFASGKQTDFLRQIKNWQDSVKSNDEFIEGLKLEFLDDRIYVFSPKGDIYDLPIGATPIDFAYEVHSRVGDTCTGAKVNGKIVTLEHKLKTRDIVEVITQKGAAPKRGWLDFAKTSKAKQHIRGYFRHFDHDKNAEEGKKILAEELLILGFDLAKISAAEIKDALSASHFKTMDDLCASIGAGLTTPRQAVRIIIGRVIIEKTPKKVQEGPKKVKEADFKGMKVQLAPCCKPTQKDQVVSYITRGKGLTIHRADCKNLNHLEKERLIYHNPWEKEPVVVKIQITGKNRVGFLRDITNVVSENNINIEKIQNEHIGKEDSRVDMTIQVEDLTACSDLLKRISKLRDVQAAKRVG